MRRLHNKYQGLFTKFIQKLRDSLYSVVSSAQRSETEDHKGVEKQIV